LLLLTIGVLLSPVRAEATNPPAIDRQQTPRVTATGVGSATPTDTFSAAELGGLGSLIHQDGFESGDLSGWDASARTLCGDGTFHLALTTASSTSTPASYTAGSSNFTIEAWARVTHDGNLAGLGNSASDNARLFVSGGTAQFLFAVASSQIVLVSGASSIVDGQWHHVAAVRNGTDSGQLYVDGTLDGSTVETLASTSLDDSELWMGSVSPVGASAAGAIDEVRVSSIARYTTGFSPLQRLGADANTIALYHLDEGSGVSAADASPSGRDLSLSAVSWNADDCYGGIFSF
jgi:hypothetical protein